MVTTCLYKIKHKMLLEDYKFFSIFLMNDKLYTSVLSFGSHICNHAARIRVKYFMKVYICFKMPFAPCIHLPRTSPTLLTVWDLLPFCMLGPLVQVPFSKQNIKTPHIPYLELLNSTYMAFESWDVTYYRKWVDSFRK